ncbi:MAG TPA: hypothetical protein V6D19_02035 [Stenomitos sp.]
MKSLHRPDLYTWSIFDAERNVDFNSIAWVSPSGIVLIDPLPLSPHDWDHLQSLGQVSWIVITNSDHIRDTFVLAERTGAKVAGPQAEKEQFPTACDRWLQDGDEVVSGLKVIELQGSKTPGELALVLNNTILITGDLVRAHKADQLMLLPDAKLHNKAQAVTSLERLIALESIETVLVGDGWSVFRNGRQYLLDLQAKVVAQPLTA